MSVTRIHECVVGCKKISGNFVAAKNRDRTYKPNISIIHHVEPDKEYILLLDKDTHYIEGYNVVTGLGILNSAVENSADFGLNKSPEGVYILKALVAAKGPKEAAHMLCREGNEVYGNTILINKDKAVLLEFVKDKEPIMIDVTKKSIPTVRTNHTDKIPGGGFDLDADQDYISSATRKAVGEVVFSSGKTVKDVLDGLNYKLFGDHTVYDTNRNTTAYKTSSQMGIDPAQHEVYFRAIPGRCNFKGVIQSGDGVTKPKGKIIIVDYDEPVESPFAVWSKEGNSDRLSELKLSALLDPDDDFEDMTGLSDVEKSRIRDGDEEETLDYYIDRENDIITKLVSVQNLIQNKDPAMIHLLDDREEDEEHEKLDDLIKDFETKTMDLYRLKSKARARTQNEAARKPRKKGQHRGSSSHSDLYTDEDPKGTIHGLGFKDAATAKKGVAIVNKAKRSHAHKVQATLVMQQRAKVAKKRAKDPEKKKNLGAAEKIWTSHLEKLKKKTKKMNESVLRKYIQKILKEEAEETEEVKSIVPKNQWELLSAGDPRREAVKTQLFDLVQQTYEPIGGHFKITSADSLDRYTYWVVKDLDDDPDIDVAIMGKPDIAGQKMGAAANDGSSAASSAYKNKSAELRAGGEVGGVGNWWGEVSGKPAYAMLRRGALPVEDEGKVAQLLAGDDYVFHGEHPDPNAPDVFKQAKGWYTKKFGGHSSTKIILGNPS